MPDWFCNSADTSKAAVKTSSKFSPVANVCLAIADAASALILLRLIKALTPTNKSS